MALAFELHQSPSANPSGQSVSGHRPRSAPSSTRSGARHLRAVQAPTSPTQPALTLRRATAIVAAGVVGFVALTSLASAVGSAVIDVPSTPPAAHTADEPVVVRLVRPGDTLWAIAGEYTTGDLRPIVDELARINGGRVDLVVGQEILVPADLLELGAA